MKYSSIENSIIKEDSLQIISGFFSSPRN